MKVNNLLDFNIDYELVDDKNKDNIFKKYNILPLNKDILYLNVATSNISIDSQHISNLLGQPIKLIETEHKYLELEWQYLTLKIKLYKLAIYSINVSLVDSNNSYILEFIDELFIFCIKNDVSDIHIETLDQSVIIRVRIDGVLNQFFRFSINLYPILSSIIKFLASLDISQKRLPLDGRFSRKVDNNIFDFRVSTLPTIYGESIVIRILDNQNIQKSIDDIGFDKDTLNIIKSAISLSSGMILITGPTGSGKTTTLYSILNFLNSKEKKIITIEDPVEYKLDGINQVNINSEINLDYKTVLKNILRQDPDIIMIGEIRDMESLQMAIQASLTGHLVIATLHTNSALETVTRLLDMGAQRYLIASTLKMVLSQRLIRVLCKHCKVTNNELHYYEPVGCTKCNLTGYSSRVVISETLKLNDSLSQMITKGDSMIDILSHAKEFDFKLLEENAMKLVKDGITSLGECYNKL